MASTPRTLVVERQIICGSVHDSQVITFRDKYKPLYPGLKFSTDINPLCHRKVLATQGYEAEIRHAVIDFNNGKEYPDINTAWIPGTWEYAVTTVPSRVHTLLPQTLDSLTTAGFEDPIIAVDGEIESSDNSFLRKWSSQIWTRQNIRTFAHWHMTMLELYTRNPWSNFYAIFQDDFIAVRNLKHYLTQNPCPHRGYMNLLTFMENESKIASLPFGWSEAACGGDKRQFGRGAVALAFSHTAVETLLTQPHLTTRRRNSLKGHISVDGAIVESMNNAGWREYIHKPSLVQHTGIESSMGNNRHPIAASFPGQDYNPLTLLQTT